MQKPIYFDYLATTPVDPRVVEKMTHCLSMEGNFGNPASRSHLYGWKAEEAVENARRQVADLINAEGTLVYAGALDNAPIGEVDGGGELVPYFQNAMDQLEAGKAIETAETKAYGCTVKYGS